MKVLPLAVLFTTLACSTNGRAAETTIDETRTRYFYHGYDYGSQALYNPLTVMLNGGFDAYQVRAGQRNIFEQEYRINTKNTVDNLFVHPFRSISEEGWGKFLREEVFPLSFNSKSARWVPNYTLHLLGGGLTHRALWEWYDDHGLPWPWLWSAATVVTYGFINEVVENKEVQGRNTDCIADFWVFNLLGIALFSVPSVSRFFSETIILADWSLQPTFTYPHADLHNHGQYFAAKWPLPFYRDLRLFALGGMGQLGGLSYKFNREYSITAAAGVTDTRFVNDSVQTVHNSVEFVPSAALFLDRNNSLLASLRTSQVEDYFIHANMYPNAFIKTDPGIGLWTAIAKTGHVAFGISITRAFGLGLGYARL